MVIIEETTVTVSSTQ